jgi:response regulator NasT
MSRSLRVVVADTEVEMRCQLRGMLAQLNHLVIGVASTGLGLVRVCHERWPELVIAAVRLPDIDGIEAADRIARIARDAAIPVILYAADPDPLLIARAQRAPAQSFLIKPIRPEDLAPAIAVSVHRVEEYRKLRRQLSELQEALAVQSRFDVLPILRSSPHAVVDVEPAAPH